MLCEIGGTVGDIESLPFLEAIRQLGNELGRERALFVHLTLVPYIPSAGELKTKPTQHSVKELLGLGIQPDILLCRCDRPIPRGRAQEDRAVLQSARKPRHPGARRRHDLCRCPIAYHAEGFDREVCAHFGLDAPEPDLARWNDIVSRIRQPEGEVTIAIVGKYTHLLDSYKSLAEALTHGGIANNVAGQSRLDRFSEIFEQADAVQQLEGVHGILVPGGFGERGTEGKIEAARFARERRVPYFGICFGMQMAVIEAARASRRACPARARPSSARAPHPVIGLMTEWMRGNTLERRRPSGDLGGTMRLGAYEAVLAPGSRVAEIYGADADQRAPSPPLRGQHRLQGAGSRSAGLRFSGMSPDGILPEIVEMPDHPWFIGVQFHPELKSKPFEPHPLFTSFIKAARRPVAAGVGAARKGPMTSRATSRSATSPSATIGRWRSSPALARWRAARTRWR